MRKEIIAISIAVLSSNLAWGSYWDGNDLLNGCKPAQDGAYAGGICLGYIMGVADLQDNFNSAGSPSKVYCMPEGDDADTGEELREVVLKYLMSHPESLHQPASNLVGQAFANDYPCAPAVNP